MKTFLNLKNIIFLLCLTLFGGISYAQDIIITKNAEKIAAKVLEINISNVKYKKFSHLYGPDYSILKSDISSILYENGKVEVFTDMQDAVIAPDSIANNIANSIAPSDVNKFFQMSEQEKEAFLQENDFEIYRMFHLGRSLRNRGKKILIPGFLLSACGFGLIVIGAAAADQSDSKILVAGEIIFNVGQALVIVSIPLSATGGALKRNALNNFKNKYSSTGAFEPTLNLNFNSNGFGVAINF
jgi:hypothetical protein